MYINSIGKHDMVERIVHQIRSGAAPSAVGQRWLTTDVAASDRNVIVHIKFALSWMLHMYIIKSLTHIWPWVARLNQQCTLQRTKRDVNGWRNHTLFAMWSELMWKRSWSKLYLPNVRVDLFESGHNAGEKDSICAHEHPFNASPFAHAVHPFRQHSQFLSMRFSNYSALDRLCRMYDVRTFVSSHHTVARHPYRATAPSLCRTPVSEQNRRSAYRLYIYTRIP